MTEEEEYTRSLHLAQTLLENALCAADLREANTLCNRALNCKPREVAAWLMKAKVLLRLEDGPAALGAVEMAQKRSPEGPEVHALRAAALSQMERFPEALRAVEQAFRLCEVDLARQSLFEDLYYEKAAVLDALDRSAEALVTFEEGLARFPDSEMLRAGMEPLLRQQRRRGLKVIDGGLASRPSGYEVKRAIFPTP